MINLFTVPSLYILRANTLQVSLVRVTSNARLLCFFRKFRKDNKNVYYELSHICIYHQINAFHSRQRY